MPQHSLPEDKEAEFRLIYAVRRIRIQIRIELFMHILRSLRQYLLTELVDAYSNAADEAVPLKIVGAVGSLQSKLSE